MKKNKRLYNIWACMKQRCNNPKHTAAIWYHDKGIRVCDDWLSYKNFEKWSMENGYSDDLSIDRIDPDGNYEPQNCRWISIKENRLRAIGGNQKRTIKRNRYQLWKERNYYPDKGKKLEFYGEYPLKRDAEKIKEELNQKIRKSMYEKAIENGETNQNILQRILKRETWMSEKYSIFHIEANKEVRRC